MTDRIEKILAGPPDIPIQQQLPGPLSAREARWNPWVFRLGRSWCQDAIYFDHHRLPWLSTPRRFDDFPKYPPKAIYCSFIEFNPGFRRWIAWAVERAAKLHWVQHGGSFGSARIMRVEDYLLDIADVVHTWGWTRGPKTSPGPSWRLREFKKKAKTTPTGTIYWILTAADPSLERAVSSPQGKWFQSYIDDQYEALNALPDRIRQRIVVRQYPIDYGWPFRFPSGVSIEPRGRPLLEGLAHASVAIVTSNETTLLQLAASHVPFLAYWKKDQFLLRESAVPYFDGLEKERLLFHDPNDLACELSENNYATNHAVLARDDSSGLNIFRNQYART